jgi:hypothetical protein
MCPDPNELLAKSTCQASACRRQGRRAVALFPGDVSILPQKMDLLEAIDYFLT